MGNMNNGRNEGGCEKGRKMVRFGSERDKGGAKMKRRDWQAIKTEYITTDCSLSDLGRKHSIPDRTIKNRSATEGWVALREEYCTEVVQKLSQNAKNKEVERLERLQVVASDVTELLQADLGKIMGQHREAEYIGEGDIKIIKDIAAALKTVSDAMRDLYMIPAPKTEEEENTGGVIFLPQVMERGKRDGNHMDSAAEAN